MITSVKAPASLSPLPAEEEKSSVRQPTAHPGVWNWVREMIRLCKPDSVYWCDGSNEEKERLTQLAVAANILIPPRPEKAARLLLSPVQSQ